nr:citramalyl-CoA lyase, mitochondrial isoform X2 [Hydra vulgaris]
MQNCAKLFKNCIKNIKDVVGKQPVSFVRGYSPKRSLLYVPGDSKKKIAKASTLPADIVVLDCEDAVAFSKKFKNESSKHLLSSGHSSHKLSIIGQVETAKGMLNLRSILDEATKEHSNICFEAFVFGSDDYLASIGAVRTINASELLFARQYFIMHVKGYNLQAIDMVDINFNDLENLKKQSEEGAKMGFTGKQVIHPSQINIVNQCFSPSSEQIETAKELINAFNEQQKTGQGVFTFRGLMIDMPSVKQAQNIIALSKKLT